MTEIINLLTNNGIGIVCVAYMIYFQQTTMKEVIKTLQTISERLTIIENQIRKGEKEMKLSKEELKKKIDEMEIDDERKIELLEDVEDSFEVSETDNSELEEIKRKYEELKAKYRARFFDSDSDIEEKEDDIEEKEVVDIKEI